MSEKLNLLDVRPYHYNTGMFNPASAILTWLRNEDAFWEYDGKPSPDKPHAELSGGACSNGFIDMPRILRYPYVAEILGRELGRKLKFEHHVEVDVVVSSPYSAITFGHEVAKELGAVFRHTIKDPADPKQKRMLWRGEQLPAGSQVLRVEELITTASTLVCVTEGIEEAHQGIRLQMLPVVGMAVHRPDSLDVVYNDFVALLKKAIQNFPMGEKCPYCEAGSKKLRPRQSPQNWAALTGA